MTTPAEQHAQEENLTQVLVTPFELVRAACGNPIIVGIQGGGEVLLRIPTVDEYIEIQHKAAAELTAQGVHDVPRIGRLIAEQLVKPMSLEDS